MFEMNSVQFEVKTVCAEVNKLRPYSTIFKVF